MEFIIGSTNQAKVQAVKNVIRHYFPNAEVTAIEANSGVAAQPFGDEEAIMGAMNRAQQVYSKEKNVIGIGLEGGVRLLGETMYICNWGALVLPTEQVITAGGAQIPLPNEIASEIHLGKELGPVIDRYFKAKGLRQKEGAMGMFTAGTVSRVELFTHIMHLLIGQLQYKMNHDF
ncbi:DUF84 family protein [Sporosarcina pasteurii]|uniref:inosine/xanthosine triphosphatase n=1 Tax=Sporosarcina pasteurii TaxID=1474 RepID=A0A380C659_SPOPA|nr:DUF84 family protein [Sporosarcina pasteurii]MDS9471782.1 DUF84 family protein [Sporosarcina pasteurii]QBQ04624.1 DUF84 family protein [Sporosarcina pasteurii]SUJ13691.1 Non-canonical purine NTP phosphatase [Sporosarcina pasteurii]